MEADSTTSENITKTDQNASSYPFPVHPGNFKFYLSIINRSGSGSKENQLIQSLQSSRLLPAEFCCPQCPPECNMKSKPARVVDRVQWVCESCNTKQSIRSKSFFFRLPCPLPVALQLILAWCEDADYQLVAHKLGVKPKIASTIYDKLDNLVAEEHKKCKLGGENNVVLAEMYPDCLNRLSPDTTEQPHAHRIIMMADTSRIPTRYCLHVMKENKKCSNIMTMDTKVLDSEICEVIEGNLYPNSTLVVGNYVPLMEGASTLQNLLQHCDTDMQHFLRERVWRQAVTLCAASRDVCAGAASAALCVTHVQRYLDTALYRLQFGDGFFQHVCRLIADRYTVTHVATQP